MDSTRAIIRLWRLCSSPAGEEFSEGADGSLPYEVLKTALERELRDKLDFLEGQSAEEVLRSYLQPDVSRHVGFLQFWRGMENILQACGAYRNLLGPAQSQALEGFRFLRNAMLEYSPGDKAQGRTVIQVSVLRYFIEKAGEKAEPEGVSYWRAQLELLPPDPTNVTGEEVASALLAWLEDLVGDEEEMEEDEEEEEEEEDVTDPEESANEGADWERRTRPTPEPPPETGSVLERRLTWLLGRSNARCPSPNKRQAAEWRDALEFQAALKRALEEMRRSGEEVTVARFHAFARAHIGDVRRRTRERSASPRLRGPQLPRGARTLASVLRDVYGRRLGAGFAAFAALRRARGASGRRRGGMARPPPSAPLDFDLFAELLRAQCTTAVLLEHNMKLALRAGGLASGLCSVARRPLREAFVQLAALPATKVTSASSLTRASPAAELRRSARSSPTVNGWVPRR